MFRAERPQRGRYRQFYQLGAEIFGDAGPGCDAEMIDMLVQFLARAAHARTSRSSSTRSAGPRRATRYREALVAVPRRRSTASLSEDSQRRLETNPAAHPRLEGPARSARRSQDAPTLARASSSDDDRAHFDGLRRHLDALGHAVHGRRRSSCAASTTTRARSSRSKARARSSAPAARSSAAAATTSWSRARRAAGAGHRVRGRARAAAHRERARGAGTQRGRRASSRRWATPSAQALVLARDLRKSGIRCEVDTRGTSLKSQLRRANALGARVVLILGESEIAEDVVQVKDLEAHTQETMARDQAIRDRRRPADGRLAQRRLAPAPGEPVRHDLDRSGCCVLGGALVAPRPRRARRGGMRRRSGGQQQQQPHADRPRPRKRKRSTTPTCARPSPEIAPPERSADGLARAQGPHRDATSARAPLARGRAPAHDSGFPTTRSGAATTGCASLPPFCPRAHARAARSVAGALRRAARRRTPRGSTGCSTTAAARRRSTWTSSSPRFWHVRDRDNHVARRRPARPPRGARRERQLARAALLRRQPQGRRLLPLAAPADDVALGREGRVHARRSATSATARAATSTWASRRSSSTATTGASTATAGRTRSSRRSSTTTPSTSSTRAASPSSARSSRSRTTKRDVFDVAPFFFHITGQARRPAASSRSTRRSFPSSTTGTTPTSRSSSCRGTTGA